MALHRLSTAGKERVDFTAINHRRRSRINQLMELRVRQRVCDRICYSSPKNDWTIATAYLCTSPALPYSDCVRPLYLSTIFLVQVQQSPRCVCAYLSVYVRTITVERNDLRSWELTCWFHVMLSRCILYSALFTKYMAASIKSKSTRKESSKHRRHNYGRPA